MKKRLNKRFLSLILLSASVVFANDNEQEKTPEMPKPQGWSFDIGGTYTWMSFLTPPTYSGSTGGFLGKVTYQIPDAFFGQARTFYNIGTLTTSVNKSHFHEWYTEFVGGYCITALENLTITPYAGIGLDFLHDHHTGFSTTAPIKLKYDIYYAIVGLETHYTWPKWMVGLQVDCLPTFDQYLRIEGLSGAAWKLKNRVGVEAQVPIAYRYIRNYWVELVPYYRFLPVGASHTLDLGKRNLNQWGAFLIFRFYL